MVKYNDMQLEVLFYYGLVDTVSYLTVKGMTYFTVDKIIDIEDLLTHNEYLSKVQEKYPYLVPFYIISRNHYTGYYSDRIGVSILRLANMVVKKIRKENEEQFRFKKKGGKK